MTEERIARNDSIFRDANEQINASAKEHGTDEKQAVDRSATTFALSEVRGLRHRVGVTAATMRHGAWGKTGDS